MSNDLFDTIRRIVQSELRQCRLTELAVVQEQHPHADEGDQDNYACTIQLLSSSLVLPNVPVATQHIGAVNIPNVGDMVTVQFINGDINAPIITGRLYNAEDRPPVNNDLQHIMQLPADGSAIRVEMDGGDTAKVSLQVGDACTVICQDDDPVISLDVAGGSAIVHIDRDGSITLESNKNLSVKATEIQMEASNISIDASTELTLKGGVVNIN